MRLLARLILALVVAMSIPMTHVQACHADAPAQATAAHGSSHHVPAPEHKAMDGVCVGCIAPATLHPPVLAARLAPSRLPSFARLPTVRNSQNIRPATPPPRLG